MQECLDPCREGYVERGIPASEIRSQRESLKAGGGVQATARFAGRECSSSGVTQDSGDDGWQGLLREGKLYDEPSGRRSDEGPAGRLNGVSDTSGARDAFRH